MGSVPGHVALVETGPRNARPHAPPLAAEVRIGLVDRLVQAGLRDLVVAGGADADQLLHRLPRHPEVRYSLRVDDLSALEGTIAAGATEIAVRTSGTGSSVEAGLQRLEPVAKLAAKHGVRLRGHLHGVVVCPHEGPVEPGLAAGLCGELLNLGCFEVSLGDDITAGDVAGWRAMWEACAARVGPDRLAARFRGDWDLSLPCLDALLPLGLQTVDTAVGGLGPDGLVSTEDTAAHLHARGIATGVDCDALVQTAWWFGGHLGRAPVSRLAQTHRTDRS